MRYFGTVISFDKTRGGGSIHPDHRHEEVAFERGAVMWRRSADPTPGQRLSYEIEIRDGRKRALNLRTIFLETPKRRIPMRAIHAVVAGVAAISLITPVSARAGQDRTYSRQLRTQIDNNVIQGRISPGETVKLRAKLGKLVQLERSSMPNGISGPEYAVLFRRSAALAKDIRIASSQPRRSEGNRAMIWESGNINGHWVPDARFAGLRPSDRFSGDARIGQHVTASIVSMPVQYRSDYVDTDQIYYGYDNGRIYQIDRKTQMILALLDIMP